MLRSTVMAVFLCVSWGAAADSSAESEKPDALQRLGWLSGCWSSVDGEPGSGEFWTSVHGESLFGISRSVRNGLTVGHEFMEISPGDSGALALTAHPSGQATTRFDLVELEDGKVVFENKAHDFPQLVSYELRSKNHLVAVISGPAEGKIRRVEFPMRRSLCGSDRTN